MDSITYEGECYIDHNYGKIPVPVQAAWREEIIELWVEIARKRTISGNHARAIPAMRNARIARLALELTPHNLRYPPTRRQER